MSLSALFVIVVGGALLVGLVALLLVWAFAEELPRAGQVPYYERLEPGEWRVRLESVGRRRLRTMRLINEVLGGDLAAAKAISERPPALVIEGVSEAVAHDLVAALAETGATAVAETERQKAKVKGQKSKVTATTDGDGERQSR